MSFLANLRVPVVTAKKNSPLAAYGAPAQPLGGSDASQPTFRIPPGNEQQTFYGANPFAGVTAQGTFGQPTPGPGGHVYPGGVGAPPPIDHITTNMDLPPDLKQAFAMGQDLTPAQIAAGQQAYTDNHVNAYLHALDDQNNAQTKQSLDFLNTYMPHQEDYTQPYDQAISSAKDTYGKAVPAINDTYQSLLQQLASIQGDHTATAKTQADALAQRLGAVQSTQGQDTSGILSALQGGGLNNQALLKQYADASASDSSFLKDQGQGASDLQSRLGQVFDQGMTARTADAKTANANSLGQAQSNLNDMLNQLNIQRAGAVQKYNSDNRQATLNLQQMKTQMAQAQLDHIDKVTAQYKTTNRDLFVKNDLAQARAEQPAASYLFDTLRKEFGDRGEDARSQIMQHLQDQAPAIASGHFVVQDVHKAALRSDPTKRSPAVQAEINNLNNSPDAQKGLIRVDEDKNDPNHYQVTLNSQVDPQTVASWVNQYYDESPALPPQIQAQVDALNAHVLGR